MKLQKANLLIAACFIVANLCGQKNSDKQKSMLFLSRIDSATVSIDIKGDLFEQYNQKIGKEFVANNRTPIVKEKLDSLNKYFEDYMREIENSIQKLNSIVEYDGRFNLIQKNISFLSSERKYWEKSVSILMGLYKNGSNYLTKDQRNEINNSFAKLNTEQKSQNDKLILQFKDFSNAHGFEYVQKHK